MVSKLEDHFRAVVEHCFPKDAELHVQVESDDICIYIDWKLMNDPQRPNKRSKKIKVRVSQFAIEDYFDGRDNDKVDADKRLRYLVEEWLKKFDPDHKNPAHTPVPIEELVITNAMLNSRQAIRGGLQ
ncbi:MAG: hypothetical protein K8R50_00435 [Betaproteobacteria bacterium]|nr:hypothetical protein [Betaproteobacteria bacterium]